MNTSAKGPYEVTQRHPYLQVSKPLVFAHRGASVYAPANTRPAFVLAVASGADALETDIHWTQDGHIVVCHDETVDSMSNGTGHIRNMTLAQLKELDFGFRYTRDNGKTFPYRGTGVQILTLEELLCEFSDIRVNMDIKPKHPGSLRQLIDLIYHCQAEWRVMLASFHTPSLRRVRGMAPHLATSASTLEVARFWSLTRVRSRFMASQPALRPPYQALQVPTNMSVLKVISPGFIRAAHEALVDVHVWTIDDETQMRDLFRLGVDGIVSNDPALAVRIRDQEYAHRTLAIGGPKWRS